MKQYHRILENSLSESIIELIKLHDCWLAGGAILSIATKKEINDFDIYFKSYEELESFYYELGGSAILSETKKSLVLQKDSYKLNLIFHNYYNSYQEIFNDFDFTICKAAYDGENFYFHEDFYKDVCFKSLVYTPSFAYPISTLLRIKKYTDRGYTISRNEMIKIALQISQHEITSVNDLEEELGSIYGVDLSDLFPEDFDFTIDNVINTLSEIDIDLNDYQQKIDYELPKVFTREMKSLKTKDGFVGYYDHNIKTEGNNCVSFPIKLYKYVNEDLCSFFRSSFKYEIGKIIEDRHGLYCGLYINRESFSYRSNSNRKLIELEVYSPGDIVVSNSKTLRVTKCIVQRIVEEPCDKKLNELPLDFGGLI